MGTGLLQSGLGAGVRLSPLPAKPNSPVHHTEAELLSGAKDLSICIWAAPGFLSGCSGRSAVAFQKMTNTKKYF